MKGEKNRQEQVRILLRIFAIYPAPVFPENEIALPKKSTVLISVILTLLTLTGLLLLGQTGFYGLLGFTKTSAWFIYFSRLLVWACLGFTLLYSRIIEKQNLLIWKERNYRFIQYLASVIAIFAGLIIALGFLGGTLKALGYDPTSQAFEKMIAIFKQNYFLIFFTSATAGAVEELIFRGYLIPRLQLLMRSPVAAVLLSSALFGLMHIGYGTTYQLFGPFIIGLAFGFYYWEFRNIKVVIVCHCLWDIMAICLKIWVVKH